MRIKLPSSVRNWLSLVGATIALVSLFLIAFLFIISTIFEKQGTYLGLIIYILLPTLLILGLVLILAGMILTHYRRRKIEGIWPRIDLNIPEQRHAFQIFIFGTAVFILLSAVGSYEAFELTESVQFCGELCHSVMRPEYQAYQYSPHARVACVECHVGEGADWYIRSKLSGLYQVYAVTFNIYPKPIPTPIHNLRPARETCERCHWPEKFYAYKLRTEYHYLPDEKNTKWQIQLTMKIGAEHSALGLQKGIHWHINPDIKIEYIAADEQREEIPWVRMVNLKTGKTVVFQDEENALSKEEISKADIRSMDCMDCHNRPSHQYKPPAFFINEAITAGAIPQSLPEIKAQAVDVCDQAKDLSTTDSAFQFIEKNIHEFYSENYPEIYKNQKDLVIQAVQGIEKYFSRNIFPEMKVNWSAYPNHIGHLEFNGCFRCHNDRHRSEDGEVISKDCSLCHLINAQGPENDIEMATNGKSLEFRHPEDIGGEWKESLCTDCHTGLAP
ncbi:MAG: cytochrome C [Calditrichaeota bacterium]|nr:cytochrome C [Calditrichota bacterium]